MVYRVNIYQFLMSGKEHILRIREAEDVKGVWKTSTILLLVSMFIYGWMAYLGMGSDHLSSQATSLSATEYEQYKFWFLFGRVIFGAFFAIFMLWIVPFLLYGLTYIPYKKLAVLEQLVLSILLLERVIWIPLFVFAGLDWTVSPFSLGIIASYMTDIPWIIAFFGSISLFQVWVIWLQIRFIRSLSTMDTRWIWLSVSLLHIFYWLVAAFTVFIDTSFLGGVI